MATQPLNIQHGLSVGTPASQKRIIDGNGNIITPSIKVENYADLGDAANVRISGGVDGAVLGASSNSGLRWIDVTTTIVYKKYVFNTPRLVWSIKHNLNTTQFSVTLRDSYGNSFISKTRVIDTNEFVVELTSAITGSIDVVFNTTDVEVVVE